MLLALQYKLCQQAAMRGNIWSMVTNSFTWQYNLWQRIKLHGKWYYCNDMITMAITWSLAINKITWQMILLPWHNDRGNNVWSLAMNKIAWQTVYLPRHNGRGNNTLGNKILAWQYRLLQRHCLWQLVSIAMLSIVACTTSCYEDRRGKCLYRYDRECCHNILLPCLATDNYGCKKPQQLQRQTCNGCNTLLQRDFLQPLATNVIWLQHLPFATKLGLLQCFFVVAQGLEVSSVCGASKDEQGWCDDGWRWRYWRGGGSGGCIWRC